MNTAMLMVDCWNDRLERVIRERDVLSGITPLVRLEYLADLHHRGTIAVEQLSYWVWQMRGETDG